MIDLIATHLKAAKIFKEVSKTATFASLKDVPPVANRPAAYVFLERETASEDQVISITRQKVTSRFSVAVFITASTKSKKEEAPDEVVTLNKKLIEQLLGWVPEAGADPVTYQGMQIVRVEKGVVAWVASFNTGYQLRG